MSCAANENNTTVNQITENENDGIEVTSQDGTKKIAENVKASEFDKLMKSQPGIILDVRTPGEFQSGHIPGAINIDYYASDFAAQIAKLDKTQNIYVYCKSGGRSGNAQNILVNKEFNATYNLIGGYSSWSNK